jgi:hypothetical protein
MLEFHPIGIGAFDGEADFTPPQNASHASYRMTHSGVQRERFRVQRLSTIMTTLGHDRVDVLKLDVEGAEYAVIDDLLASEIPIGQIAVEFHHRSLGLGVEPTRAAIRSLVGAGYEPVFISPRGNELTFIAQAHVRVGGRT